MGNKKNKKRGYVHVSSVCTNSEDDIRYYVHGCVHGSSVCTNSEDGVHYYVHVHR